MTTSSNKFISFVAPNPPPLLDGVYNLQITNELTYSESEGSTQTQTFNQEYNIFVKGERFSINPKEIHKIFPPENTLGDYDTVIPHIVFKRRTLPWDRTPLPEPKIAGFPPTPTFAPVFNPKTSDYTTTYSWLALLVFEADTAPKLTNGTLSDLFNPPVGVYSYGSAGLFLEPDETSADDCAYIDLNLKQFLNAPSINDLIWSTHGRCITENGTATDFSIVMANRLPTPGARTIVHLVSLEGLGDQLPQDDGSYSSTPTWDFIRLASLKQWSFQTLPLQVSFEDMLKNLNGGISDENDELTEAHDCELRLPAGYAPEASGFTQPVSSPNPFDSGYTILKDTENTFSWYRGPFIPITLTSKAPPSQLAVLDPTTLDSIVNCSIPNSPTIDRSYSTAWQLGRMIALADKNFAEAQVSWKRECRLKLNSLIRQSLSSYSKSEFMSQFSQALTSTDSLKSSLGATLYTDNSAMLSGLHIPQALVDWLGNLALLKSVPFHFLVPDINMLPTESLKFFTVDQCWLACLLDGAWSLDRQPASCFDNVYTPWSQLLNGSLLPSFAPADTNSAFPTSGLLLNSKIIPAYAPGICFNPDEGVITMLDSPIGPNTQLLLFNKTISTMTIHEPPEGIHFGLDLEMTLGFTKNIKYLQETANGSFYPTPTTGVTPEMGQDVLDANLNNITVGAIPFRSLLNRIIQLDTLAQNLYQTLGSPPVFTPAEFSFELVQSVQSVQFNLPPQS